MSAEKFELLAHFYEKSKNIPQAISVYKQLNNRLKTTTYNKEIQRLKNMKANCIGVETPTSDWSANDSLQELSELAETAGLSIINCISQQRQAPNQLSYVGKGKLNEIKEFVKEQH